MTPVSNIPESSFQAASLYPQTFLCQISSVSLAVGVKIAALVSREPAFFNPGSKFLIYRQRKTLTQKQNITL
jgi:hypothetical protein